MKPMGLGLSLFYFGIPTLALAAGFYLLKPFLIKRGMLPYYAYSLGLGLPLLAMLVASIVAYRLEGNPLEWAALMAPFNYRPLSLRDLLIVAGIFAVEMTLYLFMTRVTGWPIGQGIITLSANGLDPRDHQCRHRRAARQLVPVLLFADSAGDKRGGGGILVARICAAASAIGFCRLDSDGSRPTVDALSRLQVLGFAQPAAALTWPDLCRAIPEQQFRRSGDAFHQQWRCLLPIFLGVLEK